MIFSKAVLSACLAILGFLCLFVAGLLAILAAVNAGRGDPVSGPLIAAVAFGAGGLVSRWASARISASLSEG